MGMARRRYYRALVSRLSLLAMSHLWTGIKAYANIHGKHNNTMSYKTTGRCEPLSPRLVPGVAAPLLRLPPRGQQIHVPLPGHRHVVPRAALQRPEPPRCPGHRRQPAPADGAPERHLQLLRDLSCCATGQWVASPAHDKLSPSALPCMHPPPALTHTHTHTAHSTFVCM